MAANVYEKILEARIQGRKMLCVLLDPDSLQGGQAHCQATLEVLAHNQPDLLLVGGSLLLSGSMNELLAKAREYLSCPLLIFPADPTHIAENADAILLLSLISGRNPEYLIGKHVVAAPLIRRAGLEPIATGYLLVDSGLPTTAHYMSQTQPLPHNKPDIAAATVLAGEMLGLKMMYLDAGSGAQRPVAPAMIRKCAAVLSVPLMVGGGLSQPSAISSAYEAGADLLVVGTAFEQRPEALAEMLAIRDSFNH